MHALQHCTIFALTLASAAHAQHSPSGETPLARDEQPMCDVVSADVARAWDDAFESARNEFVRPRRAVHALVDDAAMEQALLRAPDVDSVPAGDFERLGALPVVLLPMPDGSVKVFAVARVPTMEAPLAARFPQLRSYAGVAVDDSSVTVRFEWTNHGLRAQIRGLADGFAYIDPWRAGSKKHVVSYWLSDASTRAWDWSCGTGHDAIATGHENDDATFQTRGSHTLKQFRLAIACTGEYGTYQSSVLGNSPNVADAMSALVTITNRTNATFEPDMGVRFVMIANNDAIAFINAETDPYSTQSCPDGSSDCSGPLLGQNVTALNSIIGSANFDVGHVVTRLPGGVANLRAVCGNNKAAGVSGIPRGGENEPVSALVVVHELGHQFGANHSYNGALGRCGPNWAGTTAREPGGGSTQMSYPGACPVGGGIAGDNLVIFADPYFHTGSLIEMRNFLNSASANCAIVIDTNNTLPMIASTTPNNRTIPPQTPFILEATISDANGGQTFVWDQMDNGPQQTIEGPTSLDNGTSPLFRSLPPVASGARVFPNWASVLARTDNRGERYARVAGSTRRFRVSVRDNVPGGGGSVSSATVQMSISGGAPLQVTQPASGTSLRRSGNSALALQVGWTPSSFSAPVGVTAVDILLSVDSGATWTQLAGSVPLSLGQATVNVAPGVVGSPSHVMVRAVGSHFFNVSGAFSILPPCGSIDFNRDGLFPDDQDLIDFLSVLAGGTCSTGSSTGCDIIDFNRDGLFPDDADLLAFLVVLAGGSC
jgi:hypothetical protein